MDLFSRIEENRDENIAIPFFGWLKNPVEMMMDYVIRGDKMYYWVRRYGIIKELISYKDKSGLTDMTFKRSKESFLMNFGRGEIEPIIFFTPISDVRYSDIK